jgi:hypothetical protein
MKVETESGQHHFQVQAYLDTAPQSERPAPSGHGRNGAAAFMGANRVAVEHATLRSGDPCPERREGRVYRQKEPATLIHIVGQAPLKATVFEMERLRCNACGEVFTASEALAAGPPIRSDSQPPTGRNSVASTTNPAVRKPASAGSR